MNAPETPPHAQLRRHAGRQPNKPTGPWCGQALNRADLDPAGETFAPLRAALSGVPSTVRHGLVRALVVRPPVAG